MLSCDKAEHCYCQQYSKHPVFFIFIDNSTP